MPRSFRVGTGVAVCTAGALLFAPLIATPAYAAPSTSVVISEVYVDGGFTGAAYTNKFVELRNLGTESVDLSTWSLQYRASSNGNAPSQRWALDGTIEPGATYLVQGAAPREGTPVGAALPTPDLVTDFNGSGTSGTVVLANTTGAVDIGVDDVATRSVTGLVDLLGYRTNSSGSNIWEGQLADATGTSAVASLQRVAGDTDVNAADFGAAAPTPKNSAGETAAPTTPDPEPTEEPSPEPTEPGEEPSPEPTEPTITPIAAIQGTGATSPLSGTVTTEGVVTAKYDQGGFNGYYLQTEGTGGELPTEGSHGIFVYSPQTVASVEVGSLVEVTGTVSEYKGSQSDEGSLTQLRDVTVQPIDRAFAEPVPLEIALPTSDEAREAIEGMLIHPEDDFTISGIYGADQYGTIGLATGGDPLVQPTAVGPVGSAAYEAARAESAAKRILLDDGSSYNYWNGATNGATPLPWITPQTPLSIGTGVAFEQPVIIDQRFDEWGLQPTSFVNGDSTETVPVEFTPVPRDTAVGDVGGDISVANFNVLNYFSTTGDQLSGCTYFNDRAGIPVNVNRGCDARGAATEASLERQAAKIVSAINQLDASVVGLSEIENSARFNADRDEALSDLVTRLNAAAGSERWAFVPSPAEVPASEDVIRNAFIYQTDAVEPIGESSILLDSAAFSNARQPLAQTFRPVGGDAAQDTVVIVNHFKSKGSADDATGDNVDEGDGVGGWNGDRTRQAQALAAFADTVEAEAGTERSLLIGDFNSYAYESPLAVLEAAGYRNIGETTGKHTYSFDEMVGSLDHVFASAGTAVTGADIWNINSVESTGFEYSKFNYNIVNLYDAGPFRSSDHDPIKVGLDLSADAETTTIQVLGINDFHGHIKPNQQEAGIAVVAGAAQQFRAQNPNTLFLSAGDNIGASAFESRVANDEPAIDSLVMAGVDMSIVGNHEFDLGWDDLSGRVLSRYEAQSGLDDAGRFAVGANVYDAVTGEPVLDEYSIHEIDGVRVGVIGTVTTDMPSLVNPDLIADITFGNQLEAIERVSAQLSDGKDGNGEADVIIAVMHEGATIPTTVTDPAAICATVAETTNGFGEVVREAPAEVDAIISGHTHAIYDCAFPVEGRDGYERPVLQAFEWTKAMDRLELTVDRASGEVLAATGEVVDLVARDNTANFPADRQVKAFVDAAVQEADVLGAVPIGKISGDISRALNPDGTDNRGAESAGGNFVADVQLWATSEEHPTFSGTPSDFALMNPGGVRADLLYAGDTSFDPRNTDGVVTYKEAANVQTFGNSLFQMNLTGAQVKAVLEEQWQPASASRPFLHLGLSANVDYTFDPAEPAGERIQQVRVDGAEIVDTQSYRVTVNSFLAAGGDNFVTLREGTERADSGINDLSATVDYFGTTVVDPPEVGRAVQVVAGENPGTGNPGTGNPGTGNPGTGDPGSPGVGAEKPATAPAAAPASALTAALENLITSNDRSLSAGETIRIFVGEQYAGDWVQVWLYSDPVLLGGGWLQVDPTGYVTVELPDELPAGAHRLAVLDADGNVIGWQSVTVADTGVAALPDTGAQVAPVLVFAALMLAAGAVLVIARRRAAQA